MVRPLKKYFFMCVFLKTFYSLKLTTKIKNKIPFSNSILDPFALVFARQNIMYITVRFYGTNYRKSGKVIPWILCNTWTCVMQHIIGLKGSRQLKKSLTKFLQLVWHCRTPKNSLKWLVTKFYTSFFRVSPISTRHFFFWFITCTFKRPNLRFLDLKLKNLSLSFLYFFYGCGFFEICIESIQYVDENIPKYFKNLQSKRNKQQRSRYGGQRHERNAKRDKFINLKSK